MCEMRIFFKSFKGTCRLAFLETCRLTFFWKSPLKHGKIPPPQEGKTSPLWRLCYHDMDVQHPRSRTTRNTSLGHDGMVLRNGRLLLPHFQKHVIDMVRGESFTETDNLHSKPKIGTLGTAIGGKNLHELNEPDPHALQQFSRSSC